MFTREQLEALITSPICFSDINPVNIFTGKLRNCPNHQEKPMSEIKILESVITEATKLYAVKPNYSDYRIIARWMREEAINEALAEARDCGCAHKIAERIAKIGQ